MSFDELMQRIRACTLCAEHLPLEPRPILQASPSASILIIGQAPGRAAHEAGRPFDDASGDRLRDWLGISRECFYDASRFAIVPMGFCYPGRGASGDLPPRPECAPAWRDQLMSHLQAVELTLALGQYAQRYCFGRDRRNLTERVRDWRSTWPGCWHCPIPVRATTSGWRATPGLNRRYSRPCEPE